MAKLGEGDPRWLVTNREDGKNVNNWHWSEQSLYPWMKDKLTSMFEKKGIAEDDECKVWINCLDSLTGEVFMSNRKGKRKFLWDLNMKLEWCGKMKMRRASDESGKEDENKRTVKGKIECSNITVMDDDFDVKITIDDIERDADGLKLHSMAKKSTDIVRSIFKCAVEEMISSHQVSNPQSAAEPTTDSKDSSKRILSSPAVQETDKNVTPEFSSFSQVVKFNVPSQVLYETLLDPQRVSAFTRSAASISDKVGTEFSLFSGNVVGVIQELVPGSKIVQKWRFSDWPSGHYSLVSIDLKTVDGKHSEVTLSQSDIPNSDLSRTSSGWRTHFWRPIRSVFGWNLEIIK